jgi:GNAT superfamily N-acetyltransferase
MLGAAGKSPECANHRDKTPMPQAAERIDPNPPLRTRLRALSSPPPEFRGALLQALDDFTASRAWPSDAEEFAIEMTSEDDDRLLGGVWGYTLFGSLCIDMIVVVDELARKSGLGTQLMEAAEAVALSRGCHLMWLDTFAFQGTGFYEKLGFSVFGKQDGPAPIYPRYFMQKLISA